MWDISAEPNTQLLSDPGAQTVTSMKLIGFVSSSGQIEVAFADLLGQAWAFSQLGLVANADDTQRFSSPDELLTFLAPPIAPNIDATMAFPTDVLRGLIMIPTGDEATCMYSDVPPENGANHVMGPAAKLGDYGPIKFHHAMATSDISTITANSLRIARALKLQVFLKRLGRAFIWKNGWTDADGNPTESEQDIMLAAVMLLRSADVSIPETRTASRESLTRSLDGDVDVMKAIMATLFGKAMGIAIEMRFDLAIADYDGSPTFKPVYDAACVALGLTGNERVALASDTSIVHYPLPKTSRFNDPSFVSCEESTAPFTTVGDLYAAQVMYSVTNIDGDTADNALYGCIEAMSCTTKDYNDAVDKISSMYPAKRLNAGKLDTPGNIDCVIGKLRETWKVAHPSLTTCPTNNIGPARALTTSASSDDGNVDADKTDFTQYGYFSRVNTGPLTKLDAICYQPPVFENCDAPFTSNLDMKIYLDHFNNYFPATDSPSLLANAVTNLFEKTTGMCSEWSWTDTVLGNSEFVKHGINCFITRVGATRLQLGDFRALHCADAPSSASLFNEYVGMSVIARELTGRSGGFTGSIANYDLLFPSNCPDDPRGSPCWMPPDEETVAANGDPYACGIGSGYDRYCTNGNAYPYPNIESEDWLAGSSFNTAYLTPLTETGNTEIKSLLQVDSVNFADGTFARALNDDFACPTMNAQWVLYTELKKKIDSLTTNALHTLKVLGDVIKTETDEKTRIVCPSEVVAMAFLRDNIANVNRDAMSKYTLGDTLGLRDALCSYDPSMYPSEGDTVCGVTFHMYDPTKELPPIRSKDSGSRGAQDAAVAFLRLAVVKDDSNPNNLQIAGDALYSSLSAPGMDKATVDAAYDTFKDVLYAEQGAVGDEPAHIEAKARVDEALEVLHEAAAFAHLPTTVDPTYVPYTCDAILTRANALVRLGSLSAFQLRAMQVTALFPPTSLKKFTSNFVGGIALSLTNSFALDKNSDEMIMAIAGIVDSTTNVGSFFTYSLDEEKEICEESTLFTVTVPCIPGTPYNTPHDAAAGAVTYSVLSDIGRTVPEAEHIQTTELGPAMANGAPYAFGGSGVTSVDMGNIADVVTKITSYAPIACDEPWCAHLVASDTTTEETARVNREAYLTCLVQRSTNLLRQLNNRDVSDTNCADDMLAVLWATGRPDQYLAEGQITDYDFGAKTMADMIPIACEITNPDTADDVQKYSYATYMGLPFCGGTTLIKDVAETHGSETVIISGEMSSGLKDFNLACPASSGGGDEPVSGRAWHIQASSRKQLQRSPATPHCSANSERSTTHDACDPRAPSRLGMPCRRRAPTRCAGCRPSRSM
jgi:hypothetical protein